MGNYTEAKLLGTGYYRVQFRGFFTQFPKGFSGEEIDEFVFIPQHQESYREEFLREANTWWSRWNEDKERGDK